MLCVCFVALKMIIRVADLSAFAFGMHVGYLTP